MKFDKEEILKFVNLELDYNIFNFKLGKLDKLQLRGYMIEWIT